MSNDLHNQPGLEHVQPGLEVAPEPELPHVVEGPTIIEKPYDNAAQDTAQYTYQQQPQAYPGTFHQNNVYPNSGYPPAAYAASTQQDPSNWGSSQSGGIYAKDGAPPKGPTILGIPRRRFWLILAPLVALLVIGLAVGLGVGLGTRHKSSSDTPSATTTPIVCPNSNGTVYQASGESAFLVVCDIDYSSNVANSGNTDIGNKATSSVEDCIGLCSNNTACAGAGWGFYSGTNTCFMKGTLGESEPSTSEWYFVIKQDKS
ncbi:hypothetical protein F5B19DRAFT_496595 [Rostrohypoxylon terebratum]|nr:hypothetical protein F5B19DRAFT_496595 [Rostrohypoxylon terebratum]